MIHFHSNQENKNGNKLNFLLIQFHQHYCPNLNPTTTKLKLSLQKNFKSTGENGISHVDKQNFNFLKFIRPFIV